MKVIDKSFIMPYYIIGKIDFDGKAIDYMAADTETHLYYNDKLLSEQEAEKLMEVNGQSWCRENIQVKAWAYMLSDGINFICFQCIQDFILACCRLRVKKVIWYNAKFDFTLFDYYFLTNNWKYSDDRIKEMKRYGKLGAKTYTSLHGNMGQRYRMCIWDEYINKNKRRKVHKFEMIDLMNIMPGGLARNLREWEVKDINGNDIRKLEMDYVNDSIDDAIDYLVNDTLGLKRLADIVDSVLLQLTGFSLWNGDYLTAGGLAKKTFLHYMYNDTYKNNLRYFHEEFPVSPELDKRYRKFHLYKGGKTLHNKYYEGIVVSNVYKFDENSMYPHKMRTMRLPCGKPIYVEELRDNDNVKILHITRLVGKVKENKIGVWQDTKLKEYTEFIDEINPFFMYYEELQELQQWYNLDFEFDYIYEYKTTINKGFRDFIDNFYSIKSTKKGTFKAAAKLLLNSSYGKLSEKVVRETGHYELSEGGYVHFVRDGIIEDSKGILSIVIGAYITSLARVDLMYNIRKVCNEDVKKNFLYCDTDSIHAFTNNIITDDKELGKFKNEGIDYKPFDYALYWAPKTYIMYSSLDKDNPYVIHCKGVNIKEVKKLVIDKSFNDACKIFRPNYPIRCLMGINAIGGKALIYKKKFIMRADNYILDTTIADGGIFYEN